MFLAFLKSPFYNRIASMTQYRDNSYDSDYDDSEYNSDEENQYHMVRTYDDVIIQYTNENMSRIDYQKKTDINESDYYIVCYENTDTVLERRSKDCINYSAIAVCIGVHILLVYVVVTIYQ